MLQDKALYDSVYTLDALDAELLTKSAQKNRRAGFVDWQEDIFPL